MVVATPGHIMHRKRGGLGDSSQAAVSSDEHYLRCHQGGCRIPGGRVIVIGESISALNPIQLLVNEQWKIGKPVETVLEL